MAFISPCGVLFLCGAVLLLFEVQQICQLDIHHRPVVVLQLFLFLLLLFLLLFLLLLLLLLLPLLLAVTPLITSPASSRSRGFSSSNCGLAASIFLAILIRFFPRIFARKMPDVATAFSSFPV